MPMTAMWQTAYPIHELAVQGEGVSYDGESVC